MCGLFEMMETFRSLEIVKNEGEISHVCVYQSGDFRKCVELVKGGNYKMSSEYREFMTPEQLEEFEGSGYCWEDWDGKLVMGSLDKMEELIKMEYLWRMESE